MRVQVFIFRDIVVFIVLERQLSELIFFIFWTFISTLYPKFIRMPVTSSDIEISSWEVLTYGIYPRVNLFSQKERPSATSE